MIMLLLAERTLRWLAVSMAQASVVYLREQKSNLLESAYPIYAYGGIADFGYSVQGGFVNGITATKSATTDVTVTFDKPFAEPPIVICETYSGSSSNLYGNLTVGVAGDSVTTDGFVGRLYNYSTTTLSPGITWMAIGKITS